MTNNELEHYRQQLTDQAGRMHEDMTSLASEALRKTGGEASGNLSNMPVHLADLGSDSFEQEVSLNLLENEQQQVGEIVAALHRIDEGTYGICEECEKPIVRQRLRAVPSTRYCFDCASRLQHAALPGNL